MSFGGRFAVNWPKPLKPAYPQVGWIRKTNKKTPVGAGVVSWELGLIFLYFFKKILESQAP
jgi:hypothetical protein